ncbi:hypothetical protein FEM33_15885 [Dyadobacter flavalbus]|uniref:Uncharacterized protein n=1 Tax=Dyadobacter flavalbus TaxID=2579942 RepID=A0A5M8QWF6_9BACT|nr:hypothetical protein [Dyadobacter flavalbus]KAA6438763.1 hypothetical protein FEM33_15885 [Dyadobacter flavalbus]
MSLNQTPFEKGITRRTGKAREIAETINSNDNYSHSSDLTSGQALSYDLVLFTNKSAVYFDLIRQYIELSVIRKDMFQGQQYSVRAMALKITNDLTKILPPKSDQRKKVRLIHGIMRAQNPVSPPYDFSKPAFDREMNSFVNSYSILINNFKLLVAEAQECSYTPDNPEYTIDKCQSLINQTELMTKDIDLLLQKIYVIQEERTIIFSKIKDRCNAIYNRSRFLFGSYDPTFKKIYKLKLALL